MQAAGWLSQRPRLRRWGGMALVVVAIGAAFFPALQGGFVWDDNAHVTRPDLRSPSGLARIWFDVGATQQYYPLLYSAFWIEHQLWGDHPLGYHLVNLALHAAAACLVYLILRKLAIPGALLAAAIFAVHPVQVESVAWISEQKNTLSAVFYLSALLTYLHFDQTRQRRQYALALGLFVLAVLSKTTTVTLPAALLVIFWWQRGRLSWRGDVKPLIPFFLLAATVGLFVAWVERKVIGAEGEAFDLSFVERGLLAGRAIWFYLGKLVWPRNLIFVYPRWQIDPAAWWQWLFPLADAAVLIALWLVRRHWRAPLAGWLFFVGTLFPVLGFFNAYLFRYTYVADHFQYLACLGMIVLASAGIALLLDRWSKTARHAGQGFCILLLATLILLSRRQSQMYSDTVTLYQTTIERNPACWMAHNNLGVALLDAGQPQQAIEHYQLALQLRPDYAEAHNNLGVALARLGKFSEAIVQYQETLKLNPNYLDAFNNLGNALVKSNRLQEAIQQYQLALQHNPNYPEAHANLAAALAGVGQLPEAIQQYQLALQLKPDNFDALANMALAYAKMNRPSEAIAAGEKAASLARSHGDPALARQIDAWLKKYRQEMAQPQSTTPADPTLLPSS